MLDVTTIFNRNEYGALTSMTSAFQETATSLLKLAIAANKLEAPYHDMTRHKRHGFIGSCLNYDVYDVTKSCVLIQQRQTKRTKYGSTPTKNYFLIRRCGRGVTVLPAPKATVMKLAKLSSKLGEVIELISKQAKAKRRAASAGTEE